MLFSCVRWCSREYKKGDRLLAKAIWIPRSLANRRVLRWKRFPKWFLFQDSMFSVKASRCRGNLDKEEDAEGIYSEAFQHSSTRVGKVGSVSHICSNLKGLRGFRSLGSVDNKMGQWSDLTLGRWWISAEGNRVAHLALANPLSNRSLMVVCQHRLLLVHVKRRPWKPRSMSP